MPERIPVLKRPGFVFSREKADKGITNEEFDVGRGLFSIVADVAERKAVTEQHVAKFMNLAIRIKHEYRGDYIVGVLIFCGVVCQLKLIGRDRRCLDAIVALLKFVIDRPLPGSQLKPFTQTDLVNGLSTLYDSPGIWPSTHHPPSFDTCFHDFVAALYKSEVLKDPAFFVCLMRDLLESSWSSAEYLAEYFNPLAYWIIKHGDELFLQIRNPYTPVIDPRFLSHGLLYLLELDKIHGTRHPAPGLTLHRWEFWLRRIEETMVFVLKYEKPPKSDNLNLANLVAQKMARLVSKGNSNSGEIEGLDIN